jgi:hypothetical protein
VVVIVPRTEERGRTAHALRDLEAEHALVERQRAIEIGDLQMNMADFGSRIDSLRHDSPIIATPVARRKPMLSGSADG